MFRGVHNSMGALFKDGRKKQIILAVAVGLVVLLALYSIRFVKFNNDIMVMLPQQENIRKTFDFFRESPLAGNAFISFEIKNSEEFSTLIAAVDQFSDSLDSPMIRRIVTGMDGAKTYDDIREFVRLAPQLMSEDDFDVLDTKLNASFIQEKIEKLYRTLLSPSGLVMMPMMELDPLSLQSNALSKLRSLATSMEYAIEIRDGHLVSPDGCRALVILETDISITEGTGARALIRYLEEALSKLPSGVSADLIAGHLHSLSNEKVIKHDIFVTVSVASVGFLLLFLFLFKDIRAVLLFLVPMVSVSISVLICSWILGELSYIIMGMGSLISGIAVDYCIHVYVAMRSTQSRQSAISEVAKPIMIGALTTVGVFCVFFLSQVPGYRELALFTIVSILLSLGFAILLLPHFFTGSSGKVQKQREKFRWTLNISDKYVILIWGLLLGGCVVVLPFVRFKTDVKQYDGSETSIFQTEEKFNRDWEISDRLAMLVVEAANFNDALKKNYQIQPEIDTIFGNEQYKSLTCFWLPEHVRHDNLARWNRFWQNDRGWEIKKSILSSAAQYDFTKEAFGPFFNMLNLGPDAVKAFDELGVLKQLKPRFAFKTREGYQLVTFFNDSEKLVERVNRASKNWYDVFVVSTNQFKKHLSKAVLSEATFLSLVIAIIIPVLTFMFLRKFRLVLFALVPVVSSVLVILGMLTLFRITLNAASIIALLVVGGLSIDYGIFMVYQCHKHIKSDTRMAVTLSALTTLFGAGSLVFAKHPVLFSYGTTMAFGILAGYLSAVFVVPALYRLKKKDNFLAEFYRTV